MKESEEERKGAGKGKKIMKFCCLLGNGCAVRS